MTRWNVFFQRHGQASYTPVFNAYLDAQIADPDCPLETRVVAWIIRRSWGNHEDFCTDASGRNLTQTDCARQLGLKDRRQVNPIFLRLKNSGYVLSEGQAIRPNDNPLGLDSNVRNRHDFLETKAKVDAYQSFLEEVLAYNEPDVYRTYHEREQAFKEVKIEVLSRYTDYRRKSETGTTNDDANVANRQDTTAETGRPLPSATLLPLKPLKGESAAAVFPSVEEAPGHRASPPPAAPSSISGDELRTVREALAHFERPEVADVSKLIRACRKIDPQATAHEIALLIGEKGRRWRGPGLALFLEVVPACFPFERAAPAAPAPPANEPTTAEKIADREKLIASLPDHPQVEQWRAELAELKKIKTRGASA
jgi:hypothetical protein